MQFLHSVYRVILDIFSIKVGGIGAYLVYFHWYLKKDVTRVEFNARIQTTIYETYKLKK